MLFALAQEIYNIGDIPTIWVIYDFSGIFYFSVLSLPLSANTVDVLYITYTASHYMVGGQNLDSLYPSVQCTEIQNLLKFSLKENHLKREKAKTGIQSSENRLEKNSKSHRCLECFFCLSNSWGWVTWPRPTAALSTIQPGPGATTPGITTTTSTPAPAGAGVTAPLPAAGWIAFWELATSQICATQPPLQVNVTVRRVFFVS